MALKASRSLLSLLLAAVALLAVLAAADKELTSSYSLSGATYSSFTYFINSGIPRQRVPVDVVLSASNVNGGGLILVGWEDNSEHGEYAFTMKMSNFYIDDSTFIVRGGIPADGILLIDTLQAVNADSQATPFDFSALYFTHNLTLSIKNAFITMEGDSANLPIIVAGGSKRLSLSSTFDYFTSLQIAALQSTGGSYVLQMSETGSTQELTTITNYALVSVSNAHCCGLQSGVVSIGLPLSLSNNSYFRLRDVLVDTCTEHQTDDAMLYRVAPAVLDEKAGSITVGMQSVFVLQDIVARDSTVLQGSFTTGTEFALGDDSTTSMIGINASSLCTNCASDLPTSRASTSRLYASDWTLDGTSTADYAGAGLSDATALDSAGRDSSGTCGSPFCLPGNTAGAPNSACACTCKADTFLPACQGTQDASTSVAACDDENCITCTVSQNTCDKCRTGFTYNEGSGTCERLPCAVTNCTQCAPTNPNRCEQCRDGYTMVNGQCQQCVDSACVDCAEDVAVCRNCLAGYSLANGTCVTTTTDCKVPSCWECKKNSFTQCKKCRYYNHLTKAGTCTPCTDSHCITCGDRASRCQSCDQGRFVSLFGGCGLVPCSMMGCVYCDPNDAKRCTDCITGYSLSNVNGSCVRNGVCAVTHCATCQTNSPNICATCEAGYPRSRRGLCFLCKDANCLKCPNEAEKCVTCKSGYYLTQYTTCSPGPCSLPNCEYCDPNNSNRCTGCTSGYAVDSASGQCVVAGSCGAANCATCQANSPNTCATCASGYRRNTAGTCTACTESNCIRCDGSASECEACKSGYYLTAYGTCSPGPCGVSNCEYCDPNNSNRCTSCGSGYVVNTANGECVAAGTCAVPFCATCQSNLPNTCATCVSGYILNSATGKCVAMAQSCNVANCELCVAGNAASCAKCNSGYVVTTTSQCTLPGCVVANCVECRQGYPDMCMICKSGYSLVDGSTCVSQKSTDTASGVVSLLATVTVLVAAAVAFAL